MRLAAYLRLYRVKDWVHFLPLPLAGWAADPHHPGLTALAGGVINFSATATPRTGSSIRFYEWDFGDGTTDTTTGPITSHRYSALRTYRVTLRVVATNGDEGFTAGDVRVAS